ncbi:MAG: DUF2490 domain-containing protein [Bryobacterales bacterium]|nr:DUF2490 domain-containing protein [Bryobacterales bacterium]
MAFRFAVLPSVFFSFLLMLAMPRASMAQVETQNVFNFPWQVGESTEITFTGRLRTAPGRKGFYQTRAGAVLEQNVSSRIGLIAGYYFADRENDVSDWEGSHRYFAGFSHKLFSWKGSWEARHLSEYFDVPGAGNDYRVRHRGGWKAPTRVAPFANVEVFWDREGWRNTRWQGGVAWRISPRVSVDAHYFYEPRRSDVGAAPRHMWGTTLRIPIGEIR